MKNTTQNLKEVAMQPEVLNQLKSNAHSEFVDKLVHMDDSKQVDMDSLVKIFDNYTKGDLADNNLFENSFRSTGTNGTCTLTKPCANTK